jgi:phosphoribosyl 1,2-cyclic phosphate phosphodiesterase
MMRLTILGSGTSTGVPIICCNCSVCTSRDPKNTRTRASLWVEQEGHHFLIDTSTDLRQQALANRIPRVDAVLFTHAHADHVLGLDEIRVYNFHQKAPIPCYGGEETLRRVRQMFSYIFSADAVESFKPQLSLHEVSGPFKLHGLEILPVPVRHGSLSVLGYRFDDKAYVTDCNFISEESKKMLRRLDLLILSAIRYQPHPTHFSLEEALEVIRGLAPKRAILTHLSHAFDYAKVNAELPKGVELAFDGMKIES